MSTLQAAQISAAARSIDLTTTITRAAGLDLINLLATAGSSAGIELVKWLARERLDEEAFIQIMSAYQGFAHPNSNGQLILGQLKITASKLYGLRLAMPGALGSTILRDNELRWIASTEAVILKYHLPKMVVETFIDLFLLRTFPNEQRASRLFFATAQIQAVVRKMTYSIHLHTVNIGQGISPLPEILDKIPEHYMDHQDLARAIHDIQTRMKSDIVVQVKFFAVDLLCWIYNHWNGSLVVSIRGKILFNESLGTSLATATFMVVDECHSTANICEERDHLVGFRIGGCHGSTLNIDPKTCWIKGGDRHIEPGARSSCRIPLYQFTNPHSGVYLSLNAREVKEL